MKTNTISVAEIAVDLDTGHYGSHLSDYCDSSMYICDAISEIADNCASIYYSDIKDFICDNFDALEDALNEFGWEGCGSDIYKAGQMAEYMTIERDIYDHLADSLALAALDFYRYDIGRGDDIPEDLADAIQEWADSADSNDRMDDICDKVRDWLDDMDAVEIAAAS